jgi:hypothetical protein
MKRKTVNKKLHFSFQPPWTAGPSRAIKYRDDADSDEEIDEGEPTPALGRNEARSHDRSRSENMKPADAR